MRDHLNDTGTYAHDLVEKFKQRNAAWEGFCEEMRAAYLIPPVPRPWWSPQRLLPWEARHPIKAFREWLHRDCVEF